jgi:hypothetical protein
MIMDYEQKYKAALEWMQGMYGGLHGKTKEEAEKYFPELSESEDERMKKAIIHILYENYTDAAVIEGVEIAEIVAWLEKQATKSVNIDIESMVSQYKQRLKSQGGVENTPVNMCLTAFRHGVENVLEELNLKKLEKQVEKKPASSEKTCKDDTILDLLQKMPSYITVDGIFYHFRLRKTTISYMAFYEGEGEGSGKVIFWMTAFSPIDLLNEMLEKLKKKGLLE